jgi:hypothetical protein
MPDFAFNIICRGERSSASSQPVLQKIQSQRETSDVETRCLP